MYIGSVRFFKHLILTIIALLIILPSIGWVYFAIQYNNLRSYIELQSELLEQAEVGEQDDHYELYDDPDAPDAPDVVGVSSAALPIPYQLMFPHVFVENDFQFIDKTERTVYLTFDDGPTGLTPQILDILEERGVPATFFVIYRSDDFGREMYRRIVDEGHTLAHHSASHNFRQIYASVEDFLEDFALLYDLLFEVTGVKPELFRFPGGSNNPQMREIQQEVIAELLRRGFLYHDWDVSAGSATPTATVESIYSHVVNGVSGRQRAIVLMHDAGTPATVTALPRIIDSLRAAGYTFAVLDQTVRPTFFNYF